MKTKLNLVLVAFIIVIGNGFSQDKKPFVLKQNDSKGDIVMTWNANTPEQEMKDDIKALSQHGITITYSNVKRNDKKEIIRIDVNFEATTGAKGSLSYNQQNPIPTIKIYKFGDNVGFGEPANSFADLAMLPNFMDEDRIIYGLDYQGKPGNGGPSFKTRKMYKRDDRMPLIIEDGKVIEGGSDYSQEEIDKLLKEDDTDIGDNGGFKSFNYKGNQDFSEQLNQIQKQHDELKKNQEQAQKEAEQSTAPKDKPKLKIKKA